MLDEIPEGRIERELEAIRRCVAALESLDNESLFRALRYLNELFHSRETKKQSAEPKADGKGTQ